MAALWVPGPYCPVLREFPLAALSGADMLSSCLPFFKNKKSTGLFMSFEGYCCRMLICFDSESFLLNDFALVFSHPIVKDT